MCPAAYEVDVFEAFHSILWSEIEHLIEGVGEIEGGAHEDIFAFPAARGEDAFFDDVLAEVLHAGFLDDAIDDFIAVVLLVIFP